MAIRTPLRRLVPARRKDSPTLDLFAPLASPPLPDTPTLTESRPRSRPPQLWLAVRFPALPLLALPETEEVQAVVEGPPGRQQLVAVTAAAQACGLVPGLSRTAAEIRAPQLRISERRVDLEARALEARARAAFAFTPFVSIEAPDTVLLEIAGSLRLFGGLDALLAGMQATLGTAVIPSEYAVAPTVRAALWLVHGATGARVLSLSELPGALARLPVAVAGFEPAVWHTCQRLGVTTLGELMRLPRDGIARRLSPQVPRYLDEALGRVSQPRRRHVLAERFADGLDLPADTLTAGSLQPWCERLLAAQERFLVERDAAVAECRWYFRHRAGQAPTRLTLARSRPGSQAAEWGLLLKERLSQLSLPAAVVSISLRSGPVLPAVPLDEGLQGTGGDGHAAAARLLDRLRARLGEAAVHGVCLVPEHRPESAYRHVAPVIPGAVMDRAHWPGSPRPLWFLAAPLPLRQVEQRPWYDGPLQLLSGPERIESGWWSGQGVARDYYVAQAASGARLWIFRAREISAEGVWHLHGVFA